MLKIIPIFLLFLMGTANAANTAASSDAFKNFMGVVQGKSTTVGFGTGGVPVATRASSELPVGNGWTHAGNMGVAQGASGTGTNIGGKADIPIPGGNGRTVPVDVTTRVTQGDLVSAAIGCLGNPYCTAATVAVGAFASWLKDSGVKVSPEGAVTATPQGVPCTTAGCTVYMVSVAGITSSWGGILDMCTKSITQFENSGLAGNRKHACRMTGPQACVVDMIYPASNSDWYYCQVSSRVIDESELARVPMTLPQLQTRLEATPAPAGVVPQLLEQGVPMTVQTPAVTGPATTDGATSTQTERVPNGQGGTDEKVTTQTQTFNHTYNDNRVTTTTTTVTNVTVNGQPVAEETKREEKEILVCGLPGTPPCKIDEAGTPKAMEDTSKRDVDKALEPIKRMADDPKSFWPKLPEIRWDFALPSGCAAIALPAFRPWLQEIDVCQFQPIFHDIMGVVWVLGGLFGAISMFWRSTFAK